MKSAYELAMERLEKSAPTQKVTDEQRAQIAELDNLYQSKIAEREVYTQSEVAKASSAGDFAEIQKLQARLNHDVTTLREELEAKKEKLRATFPAA